MMAIIYELDLVNYKRKSCKAFHCYGLGNCDRDSFDLLQNEKQIDQESHHPWYDRIDAIDLSPKIIKSSEVPYLRNINNTQAKLEYLNPFGSSKDRAVKQFLSKMNSNTQEIVEASSGSTAISLIQMGHILKKKVTLFLPNDLA